MENHWLKDVRSLVLNFNRLHLGNNSIQHNKSQFPLITHYFSICYPSNTLKQPSTIHFQHVLTVVTQSSAQKISVRQALFQDISDTPDSPPAPLHCFCPLSGLNQTLSSRPSNTTSSAQHTAHAQDPRTASGQDGPTETPPSNPVHGWPVPTIVPPAAWCRCCQCRAGVYHDHYYINLTKTQFIQKYDLNKIGNYILHEGKKHNAIVIFSHLNPTFSYLKLL